jgi:rubrerythrin
MNESFEKQQALKYAVEDEGTPPGVPFYRCIMCGTVVSIWDIHESHGCPKCACPRIRPSNLSLWEKIVQIIKHPKIWQWKEYYR